MITIPTNTLFAIIILSTVISILIALMLHHIIGKSGWGNHTFGHWTKLVDRKEDKQEK